MSSPREWSGWGSLPRRPAQNLQCGFELLKAVQVTVRWMGEDWEGFWRWLCKVWGFLNIRKLQWFGAEAAFKAKNRGGCGNCWSLFITTGPRSLGFSKLPFSYSREGVNSMQGHSRGMIVWACFLLLLHQPVQGGERREPHRLLSKRNFGQVGVAHKKNVEEGDIDGVQE